MVTLVSSCMRHAHHGKLRWHLQPYALWHLLWYRGGKDRGAHRLALGVVRWVDPAASSHQRMPEGQGGWERDAVYERAGSPMVAPCGVVD